jgi:hypothetical protein
LRTINAGRLCRSRRFRPAENSLIIANQIPFSWLAYFWGGHSFLYTSPKHFADTVNVFQQRGGTLTAFGQAAD